MNTCFRYGRIIFFFFAAIGCQLTNAQRPVLVVPAGHTSIVSRVAWSADGAMVSSVSWDNTAKIWNPEGRLLFDLKGHTATVTGGCFSPDGQRFYTVAKDSTLCAWSLGTGALLFRCRPHSDWITDIQISSDGRTLLTGGWDGSLVFSSAVSGKTQRKIQLPAAVLAVFLHPGGRWFAALGKDSVVRLFGPAAGAPVAFRYAGAWPTVVRFSPDRRRLLIGWEGHAPVLYDLQTKLLRRLPGREMRCAAWSPDGRTIAAGDAKGNVMTWTTPFTAVALRDSEPAGITAVGFLPDGTGFFTTGKDGSASFRSRNAGGKTQTWTLHKDWINDLAVSPRTGDAVTASSDGEIAYIHAGESAIKKGSGHSSPVLALAFAAGGEQFLTVGADSLFRTWDTRSGKLLESVRTPGTGIDALRVAATGQLLLTGMDSVAWLCDSATGSAWRPLRAQSDWIQCSAFSPSGRYLATGSWDGTVAVYATGSGKPLFRSAPGGSATGTICFSAGDSLLAAGGWDGLIQVFHLPEGQRVARFAGHSGKVRSLAFDRQNRQLLSAAWDSTARLWDLVTGEPLQTFKEPDALNQAMFINGDSVLLLASMDHSVKALDWRQAGPLYRIAGASLPATGFWYDSLSRRLTVLSEENKSAVWNTGDGSPAGAYVFGEGQERAMAEHGNLIAFATDDDRVSLFRKGSDSVLYSVYAIDSAEYLLTDKDNRYDGTPAARAQLYYRCGREIVDLEQMKNLRWEPGLGGKIMGGQPFSFTDPGPAVDICNYTPQVVQSFHSKNSFRFRITARSGGLAGYRIRLNEKPVFTVDVARNPGEVLEVDIPADTLQAFASARETSRLTLEAFTAGGALSARGQGAYLPAARRTVRSPDVYLISVGVSTYKDSALRLRFPSIDAERFSEAVTGTARALFNTDKREHVHPYLFNEGSMAYRRPSKAAVRALLDSLSGVAGPDDIVLFFFAGHGILQEGDPDFYLLTPEASTFTIRGVEPQVALSTRELMDWSRRLKAGKQILILDACNSGKAVRNLQELLRSRDVPEDQLRALENLRDKTGLYILSAASAGQAAYETPLYGEGFLTYALLAGLKQGTALRDNRFVDLNRWFNDAADRVRWLARTTGNRQDPQLIGGASFDLGIMDSSLAARIPLAMEKKIFNRSQFIEDQDLQTDDLDLSAATDRYLMRLSSGEKNTGFVFIPDSRRNESYSVRGRYTVSGNHLSINTFLLKEGREKVASQQAEGNATDQAQLVERCVDGLLRALPRTP